MDQDQVDQYESFQKSIFIMKKEYLLTGGNEIHFKSRCFACSIHHLTNSDNDF